MLSASGILRSTNNGTCQTVVKLEFHGPDHAVFLVASSSDTSNVPDFLVTCWRGCREDATRKTGAVEFQLYRPRRLQQLRRCPLLQFLHRVTVSTTVNEVNCVQSSISVRSEEQACMHVTNRRSSACSVNASTDHSIVVRLVRLGRCLCLCVYSTRMITFARNVL